MPPLPLLSSVGSVLCVGVRIIVAIRNSTQKKGKHTQKEKRKTLKIVRGEITRQNVRRNVHLKERVHSTYLISKNTFDIIQIGWKGFIPTIKNHKKFEGHGNMRSFCLSKKFQCHLYLFWQCKNDLPAPLSRHTKL